MISETKRTYNRDYYQRTKETRKNDAKTWYRNNRERSKATKKAWALANKEKINLQRRIKYHLNPEPHKRESRLRSRKDLYGLNPAQVAALAEKQGNACAICGQVKRLCIDHDHDTGRVRGLLCTYCNTLLALLDNDDLMFAAFDYLGLPITYHEEDDTVEAA